MIELTRLNGMSFMLNAIFIEEVEVLPDTTITLTNGKKLIVKESKDQIRDKMLDFYRNIGLLSVVEKGRNKPTDEEFRRESLG